MDKQRWERMKELLDAAAELPPERRSSFLATACAGDEPLRSEVENLLQHHDKADSFLVGNAAADLADTLEFGGNDPTFSPGETVSNRFRIVNFIGRGGMGEVYKAEDSRLHRLVALKFLPDDVAQRADALGRFQREAQTASALNHPNICTIYDISEHNGRAFIAMELLEGHTLKQAITSGPFDVGQMLDISIATSDALEAAHTRGIIHRDIKPENIFITSRGDPKVLDFGLAKLYRSNTAATQEATISETAAFTRLGVTVGTVAYMSPEQARGEPLDARTDLFSLGLVMYEMATGRRAFSGSTSAVIFAALLKDTPPAPSKINHAIPPELERIIKMSIEKDRNVRYQHVSEMRGDLQRLKRNLESGQIASGAVVRRSNRSAGSATSIFDNWRLLAGSFFFLLLGVGSYLWFAGHEGRPVSSMQTDYTQLTNFVDSVTSPALSPDGRMLGMIRGDDPFLGRGNVYVKLLPDGDPVQLTHDDHPKMAPVFSPDGSRIAFTRGNGWDWQTWTVPVLGGEPAELLPNASALTWISPHEVLYSELKDDGTMKIASASESRANQRDVYVPGTRRMAHRSYVSPDAKWLLVVEMDHNGWTPCRLVPLEGGSSVKEVGPIPSECTEAAWSPDGKWMYFSANVGKGFHLWRQRFPDGTVEQITFGATDERGIAVAPDGRSLVTSIGSQQSSVWVHFRGADQQISYQGYAYEPSFSANGSILFYLARRSPGKLIGDLRSADWSSGQQQQLLPGIPIDHYTVSPDGLHIAFTRADGDRRGIWMWSLDRRSPPWKAVASNAFDPVFSRKGELFYVRDEGQGAYIFRVKEDGTQERKAIPKGVHHLISLSPDGNWIVASSPTDDPQKPEIIVAYPAHGGRERILCRHCAIGDIENFAQIVSWSWDQKALYVSLGRSGSNDLLKTAVISLPSGVAFPESLPDNLIEDPSLTERRGVHTIDVFSVFPGPNPSTYAIWRTATQRNLYRVGLP